jgi:hypothetical protein
MRMSKLISSVALAGAVALGTVLASNSANAVVLFDDLNGTSAFAVRDYYVGGPIYNSFSTTATDYTVGSFELLLSGTPGDGYTFNVGIYTDHSPSTGVAGTVFTSNDSILTPTLSVIGFSFAPVVLDPSTRYWIGLSTDNFSSVNWSVTTNVSGPGVATEYIYPNAGPYPIESGGKSGGYINGAYQMQVDATPLPATWLMLLSGFLGLGFLAYRGTKKNAAAIAAA